MKVTQSGNSPVQSTEASGAKHAGKAQKAARGQEGGKPGNASAASGEPANAEISARGKEFARVKKAATEAPDTREEKIAALKARIAAGKYDVDSHAVADRLVDDHLKMSGIG